MGNSNKRSTSRASESAVSGNLQPTTIAVDWKNDLYIKKLICEKKLAPKISCAGENRDTECPICFVNYEHLNGVVCCRQVICTECVVSMKRGATAAAPVACPFCGQNSFTITFTERATSISKSTLDTPPTRSVSSSPPSGLLKTTYTTPEQERRLRSRSEDGSTLSASASKAAREELERQISQQRRQHLEEDEAEAALLQDSFVFGRHDQHQSRSRTAMNRGGSSASSQHTQVRLNPYRYNNSVRNGQTAGATAGRSSTATMRRVVDGTGNGAELLTTLQGLLGGAELGAVSSIEELEELMFMEALRQSANDAATRDASLPPAPPAASVSSSSAAATSSAAGSTTADDHSQATSKPSARSDDEQVDSDADSQQHEEEVDGDHEDRDSDEEDEELRLALQLSLLDDTAEVPRPSAPGTGGSTQSAPQLSSSSSSNAGATPSTSSSSPQRLIDLIEEALSTPTFGTTTTDSTVASSSERQVADRPFPVSIRAGRSDSGESDGSSTYFGRSSSS